MKRGTAEWVKKAEVDHRAATSLHRRKLLVHDAVCFHCQQCAEKYLKALMEELTLAIPKTHDLALLLNTLRPHHPRGLRSLGRGMAFLNGFAVDIRYPGKDSNKRQAEAALRWAGLVRTAARALLGIRPSRR
ncbi:MAG TPA: HEPN domain-containing protein [Gemmataceae bacterium]|nr:HEPN domain-containing protein [Gemmataceae bacterium]